MTRIHLFFSAITHDLKFIGYPRDLTKYSTLPTFFLVFNMHSISNSSSEACGVSCIYPRDCLRFMSTMHSIGAMTSPTTTCSRISQYMNSVCTVSPLILHWFLAMCHPPPKKSFSILTRPNLFINMLLRYALKLPELSNSTLPFSIINKIPSSATWWFK